MIWRKLQIFAEAQFVSETNALTMTNCVQQSFSESKQPLLEILEKLCNFYKKYYLKSTSN
jgi:hypothetical protein